MRPGPPVGDAHELRRILGTPLTVRAGGRAYRLAPLTLGQRLELEAWAEAEIIRGARGSIRELGDAASYEVRWKLLGQAKDRSADGLAVQNVLDSLAGLERQLRLCLLKHHGEVVDVEVNAILEAEGIGPVKAWLEESSTLTAEEIERAQGQAGPGRTDWAAVARYLAHEYGFGPDAVAGLTLPQLHHYTRPDERGGVHGKRLTAKDIQERARAQAKAKKPKKSGKKKRRRRGRSK